MHHREKSGVGKFIIIVKRSINFKNLLIVLITKSAFIIILLKVINYILGWNLIVVN